MHKTIILTLITRVRPWILAVCMAEEVGVVVNVTTVTIVWLILKAIDGNVM